jgi:hypothetical protein
MQQESVGEEEEEEKMYQEVGPSSVTRKGTGKQQVQRSSRRK